MTTAGKSLNHLTGEQLQFGNPRQVFRREQVVDAHGDQKRLGLGVDDSIVSTKRANAHAPVSAIKGLRTQIAQLSMRIS